VKRACVPSARSARRHLPSDTELFPDELTQILDRRPENWSILGTIPSPHLPSILYSSLFILSSIHPLFILYSSSILFILYSSSIHPLFFYSLRFILYSSSIHPLFALYSSSIHPPFILHIHPLFILSSL
jgi:hypothetical protein